MSLNVISSNSSLQTLLMQPKQDLQAQTDLGSGNLAGAQKDFAAFTQDALNLFQSSNNKQRGAQIPPSQVSTDLQALQSALSSGNLTAAQKAFAAFQQERQTAGAGHQHHHHHHHREEDTKSGDANSQNNSDGGSGAATATSGITSGALMKSLLSAYQTFDLSGTPASGTRIGVTG